jgi:hypothetical protein
MTYGTSMAARRSLLRCLPRETLERLSQRDRPHLFTIKELIELCARRWDLHEVREGIDRVFRRADPKGTQP